MAKNIPAPERAWHYTTALGFLGILETGFVRPSTTDVPMGETPACWFSANPVVELTIREMAYERRDGQMLRARNAAEHRILGVGLYRVGAPTSELLRYVDLLKAARVGLTRRRKLETIARQVGANPYEWYGSLRPISIYAGDVDLAIFDGQRWHPLEREGASARVLAEQQALMPVLTEMIQSSRSDGPRPSGAVRIV